MDPRQHCRPILDLPRVCVRLRTLTKDFSGSRFHRNRRNTERYQLRVSNLALLLSELVCNVSMYLPTTIEHGMYPFSGTNNSPSVLQISNFFFNVNMFREGTTRICSWMVIFVWRNVPRKRKERLRCFKSD